MRPSGKLQHRDELVEENRCEYTAHSYNLTTERNWYDIRRHMHPIDQCLAEEHREEKHCYEARVFDVGVACKEEPIAVGLLPHAERRVAETELQAIAHVVQGHDVLVRSDEEPCEMVHLGQYPRQGLVCRLSVFDTEKDRRREDRGHDKEKQAGDLQDAPPHEDV